MFILLSAPIFASSVSALIWWNRTAVFRSSFSFPVSTRFVMVAMPAISRTRLALKVISLMRLRMSREVVGTSLRVRGLICTITTSLDEHSWIRG